MAQINSTGACLVCGKSFSKRAIAKHLQKCSGLTQTGTKQGKMSNGFLILADGKHMSNYWLYLDVRADCSFGELDDFLREIWLECCGHMSAFRHTGKMAKFTDYMAEEHGDYDDFRLPGEINMDAILGEELEPKLVLDYEYDFGTTTALRIKAVSITQTKNTPSKPIRLLARNHAPVITCGVCKEKPAVNVDAENSYNRENWICAVCSRDRDEDMILPIFNTPRTGECGYTGSSRVHLGEDVLQKSLSVY